MAKNRRQTIQGMMVYKEVSDAIRGLPPEKGMQLFGAYMDYGLKGAEPVFDDDTMTFAWAMIKPKADGCLGNYLETVNQKRYARYMGVHRKDNPLSYDEWFEQYGETDIPRDEDNGRQRPLSPVTNNNSISNDSHSNIVRDRDNHTTEPAAHPSDNPDDYTQAERMEAARKARSDFYGRMNAGLS